TNAITEGLEQLPQIFLIGMVSAYDAFFAHLVRIIFLTRPELLSSSEKHISFKDLTLLGSVEAARDLMVEKEVDTLMRDSHADQIEWIEKKLSMTLRADLPIWPKFIEICERRNLFTHTDGRVTDQYLKICKQHGFDTESIKVQEKLS